jgi:putative acetyltransferase
MASRVLRSNGWTFAEGDLDSPDVRALLDAHFADMRSISPPDACHVLPAEGLRDPFVTFWSLREDGRLLAVGALKQLDPGHGEVKSMRAAADALGRGAGKAMLDHIVAEARRRGYARLSLETGSTEPFAAALRLYERNGFVPCGPFAGYKDTLFTCFLTRDL